MTLILLILIFVPMLFGQEKADSMAADSISTDSSMIQQDSSSTVNSSLVVDAKETKNVSPLTLTLLGMLTVFSGLLIMQLFINTLKLILNPPPKKIAVTKEEEVNKGLLSNVDLTEDEMVATITAVMMESKLHHSISNDKLTIKWQDKNPHWISTRRN
ncbi:MAG: OadG family transporter subunit [bacterium]